MTTGLKAGYKITLVENGVFTHVNPEAIKALHEKVISGKVRITDINATDNELYVYIER